jgi:serine/threonine-protein kinase RsbW
MARSHFQILAAQRELAHILGSVAAFCAANKLPEATCNLMNLALDEVLSNIVKYAYDSPETGTIDVELTYSNNKLMASIEDRGVAFNPLALQMPANTGPLQSRKEGGLGIFFVKSLLDSVGYERIGDRNKVNLTIRVPSE